MTDLEKTLCNISKKPLLIIDAGFPINTYTLLDLSVTNKDLEFYNITTPFGCQEYISTVLKAKNAKVAFGGYLEQRSLYSNTASFNITKASIRNIHLGIDIWAPIGTTVLTPIPGVVHSFKNNSTSGDYGPTIILQHNIDGVTFYTLYGHLSLSSLESLYVGKHVQQGEKIGEMGAPDINVNYAPHVHFQIIKDIQGKIGDYPGVCSQKDISFYSKNCPDPNLLLSIGL
ncbi:peptidoglycan DD-metalloendopeptidase family protein [uncultured Maribacter sp.]|uniref:peptidoglycan DD-metalloendopeptidase family protein n=1 Tax=uncultured Maribacter sp. TaxID=431308 RepID=UPI00262E16F6|nr:peptidoglycan DD-metalloendopeptidase family protein [uncultured Maribacter sp.]